MSKPARASRFTLKGSLNRQSLASTALAKEREDPSEKSACIPKAGAAEEKTRARPTQRVCVLREIHRRGAIPRRIKLRPEGHHVADGGFPGRAGPGSRAGP